MTKKLTSFIGASTLLVTIAQAQVTGNLEGRILEVQWQPLEGTKEVK